MKKNAKLGLKIFTPNIAAKIAFGKSARQAVDDRERAKSDAAKETKAAVLRAAEEARKNVEREQRAALIRLAVLRIDEGLQGWRGIARRNRATWARTRPLALEWTRLDRPNATQPFPQMIAARSAELIVQEWLEARFGTEVHDVSDDKTYDDGDGPAFKRYDLRCKSSHRRFDVKNTTSPGYAQHVLGRDLPADLVTLVGLAKVGDAYESRFELLGAADGEDLARWDRIMQDLDGVGIFVPPTRKRKGARIRPSWIFSSFRHPALARDPSSPDDPIAELDDLDAWREVPARLRLLSPIGRIELRAGDQDTGRLLSRLAQRMEELRLDRLELRHLYVLTLEDFRRRYRDLDYDPSIYGRAFVPDGLRHTDAAWNTPGGTWDPCRYYRTLLSGLTRLHRHRAAIPALIHTIHVTPAGTIIANLRPGDSRGGAKGVLFITIEDETGIANGILWPDRFEAQRRTVMSAAMIGMKGRVQKEGQVIHVICDRIVDHGPLLAQVGQMDFPHATGRGDGARHAGSPDRGDAGWRPGPRDSYWPPHANGMDPEAVVRVKSRDFH